MIRGEFLGDHQYLSAFTGREKTGDFIRHVRKDVQFSAVPTGLDLERVVLTQTLKPS